MRRKGDNMDGNSSKSNNGKDIYIYDTEGHYTWHSSLAEALNDVMQSVRKE